MKTKTKQEMRDEAWKVYNAIVEPALKASGAIVEPAFKTYREELRRIEALPQPKPEEEIEIEGYRYKLIK